MDAVSMNSENRKIFGLHRQLLNISDKINFNQILLYVEKYKMSYKINKFKISVPTLNEEFELPDGSYSVSDVQDYF